MWRSIYLTPKVSIVWVFLLTIHKNFNGACEREKNNSSCRWNWVSFTDSHHGFSFLLSHSGTEEGKKKYSWFQEWGSKWDSFVLSHGQNIGFHCWMPKTVGELPNLWTLGRIFFCFLFPHTNQCWIRTSFVACGTHWWWMWQECGCHVMGHREMA